MSDCYFMTKNPINIDFFSVINAMLNILVVTSIPVADAASIIVGIILY